MLLLSLIVFAKMKKITLKEFARSNRGRTALFAEKLGVSTAYVWQMVNGLRPVSPERAVFFETETGGVVSRKSFFPDSWERIWPELKEQNR